MSPRFIFKTDKIVEETPLLHTSHYGLWVSSPHKSGKPAKSYTIHHSVADGPPLRESDPTDESERRNESATDTKKVDGKVEDNRAKSNESIAILSMGVWYPKLWQLLEKGLNWRKQSPHRFDDTPCFSLSMKEQSKGNVTCRCFIHEPEPLDARIFKLSSQEAAPMAPPQRQALTTAHGALEKAGILPHESASHGQKTSYFLFPFARTAITTCSFLLSSSAVLYKCSFAPHPNPHGQEKANHYVAILYAVQHLSHVAAPLVTYTAATSLIYHLNQHHQHQDRFVLGGIVVGALAGMVIYRDAQDMMVKVVPWTILITLLGSTVYHEMCGGGCGGEQGEMW